MRHCSIFRRLRDGWRGFVRDAFASEARQRIRDEAMMRGILADQVDAARGIEPSVAEVPRRRRRAF